MLLFVSAILALTSACAPDDTAASVAPASTLLIRNVHIVDGTGASAFSGAVRISGDTISEIAAARSVDPATAFMQLARAAEKMEEDTGHGADRIIGTSMERADIEKLLLWPETNVCTDGALEDRHPRARGAFTRVLGRYVRERGLLSLEQAVHKMSGLAAEHMGFEDRGILRTGAKADLVLFDPDTVMDRATPDSPELISSGIKAVWVAGKQVFGDGRATGERPGAVIRRRTR